MPIILVNINPNNYVTETDKLCLKGLKRNIGKALFEVKMALECYSEIMLCYLVFLKVYD